jgi:quinol monooxygenase YgiN
LLLTAAINVREANMTYVLIIHEVETYSIWKSAFDEAKEMRSRAGELSYQLLKYDENKNHIVHFSHWTSVANAKRFFESTELIEIRKKAGVKSPRFIYLQQIESGVL